MNKQKWTLLVAALVLMTVSGGVLQHLKTHQSLGVPGIKATPVPGEVVMQIDLPANVMDFTSTNLPEDAITTNMLPKDTSYAKRIYVAQTNFGVLANIVMMGKDRTSIHKPEFCLPGQGWGIRDKAVVKIPIGGPQVYELPVSKWVIGGTFKDENGQMFDRRALYVFWFVADNEVATGHWQRMLQLARDLLTKGVLQRWSYVSYFAVCNPGQEEATFERMKQLIAASVPEFQKPLARPPPPAH
jgi:hypothetical protein